MVKVDVKRPEVDLVDGDFGALVLHPEREVVREELNLVTLRCRGGLRDLLEVAAAMVSVALSVAVVRWPATSLVAS